jgi:hypothetical protein
MTKAIAIISLGFAALALVQCSPKADAPAASVAASPAAIDYSYDIALSFTPAAMEKIKARGSQMEIAALYYGNARPSTVQLADPKDGTIHLNTDKVQVEAKDQTVHMTGAGVQTENLQHITAQKPLVQLNVYSTKGGEKDGLVGCSVFQDYVESAQAKPVAIHCDLK